VTRQNVTRQIVTRQIVTKQIVTMQNVAEPISLGRCRQFIERYFSVKWKAIGGKMLEKSDTRERRERFASTGKRRKD